MPNQAKSDALTVPRTLDSGQHSRAILDCSFVRSTQPAVGRVEQTVENAR